MPGHKPVRLLNERSISDANILRTAKVGPGKESILRIGFRCNQRCPFCFVAPGGQRVGLAEIGRRLSGLERSQGTGDMLVISGGEPTTDPDLPAIVSLARRKGFCRIALQTNAVLLSDEKLAKRLEGLDFFISLHSHIPRVYDKITGTRGQLPRALRGIRNILRRGRNKVMLNTVVNRLNLRHLPAYAGFVARLNRECGSRAEVFFSMMNDVGEKKAPALAVALKTIAAPLNGALDACRRRNLGVARFFGDCAFPVCILRDPDSHAPRSEASPEGVRYLERVETAAEPGRVKALSCRGCLYDSRCRGIFASHAWRFGLGSLKPVRPRPAPL